MGYPRPQPKDSRGVVIRPGQKVAYNRSGDVIAGEIVGVGAEVRIMADQEFWPLRYIGGAYPNAQYATVTPKPSRVKRGTSILVLVNV